MKTDKKLFRWGIVFIILGIMVLATPNFVNIPFLTSSDGFSYHLERGLNEGIVFPSDIWLYNADINDADTCENFCQVGGIYEEIAMIFYITDDEVHQSWGKHNPEQYNSLKNIKPDRSYTFAVSPSADIFIPYDTPNGGTPADTTDTSSNWLSFLLAFLFFVIGAILLNKSFKKKKQTI